MSPQADEVGPPSETPAAALGPAWDLLDALPRAVAPAAMTATTVEMAAARAPAVRGTWWRGGFAPVMVVAAAFITGIFVGRVTLTDTERTVLAHLPVLEHFDVVREAGSVEFLMAVARRNYPPPRRPPFSRPADRGGDSSEPSYETLDAAVAAFAEANGVAESRLAADRRASFATRPPADRRRLAEVAEEFQRLSSAERRDLVRVARALGGGQGAGAERDELLAAARLWHQWLATRDPAERRGVIELEMAERLEWLDRYAFARPGSGRGPGRDGGFRGFPVPGFPVPGFPRPGFPRPDGPPPFNGPPPRRPPPPGETPAPPR